MKGAFVINTHRQTIGLGKIVILFNAFRYGNSTCFDDYHRGLVEVF